MESEDIPVQFVNDPNGLPNLIVVGATTEDGRIAMFSRGGAGLTVYAPGSQVHVADPDGSGLKLSDGTSFGMLAIPHHQSWQSS